MAPISIDEVLDFVSSTLQNIGATISQLDGLHMSFLRMEDAEREVTFALRQAELDVISKDLRARASKPCKKPAAFALTLTGAAITLTAGHPFAVALTLSASALHYGPAQKTAMGA